MNKDALAKLCVEAMTRKDACTKKMAMNVVEVSYHSIAVEMIVTKDMLNGFSTCHGGQIFTLADSTFAFACNVHNEVTVATGCDISFINAAYCDDKLIAHSKRVNHAGRLGVYDVNITNQNSQLIAEFRGRSYSLKGKEIVSITEGLDT